MLAVDVPATSVAPGGMVDGSTASYSVRLINRSSLLIAVAPWCGAVRWRNWPSRQWRQACGGSRVNAR